MLNRFILPILVAIALGITVSAFWYSYRAGQENARKLCETEKLEAVAEAMQRAAISTRTFERSLNETRNQTDDTLDDYASALGIVRDNEDY